jgi:uncharacterized membrane protein YeiH
MLKSSQIGAQLSPARVFPFGATPVAASSRYVCSKSPQTPQRLKDMTEWQSIEHFQIGCCQLAPPVSASRDVMVFQTAVAILDWSGVIVFAISGALVASRKQMDIVGFVLLGTVTGIGGGTLRDVLLGANPVFWIDAPAYLLACLVVSGIVFFTAHIPQSRYKLLLWFDGLGLGIFAVVGAEKALLMGAGPTVAIAMGVITATFGGILRDLLGAESPVVLSREIYVTAALAGAATFIAGSAVGLHREVAVVLGLLIGFGLRGAAIQRGWSLPRYRSRPDE